MLRSWQCQVSEKGFAFAPQVSIWFCMFNCCPMQAAKVVKKGRWSQLLRLQLCIVLQTAEDRMDGSWSLLYVEAFQSRWKGASIKNLCHLWHFQKYVSREAHTVPLTVNFKTELFSKTKQSEIFLASIGIFKNTTCKTVFQLNTLLLSYFFMLVYVKCFHLRKVYVRLALLANIWFTFEVACL